MFKRRRRFRRRIRYKRRFKRRILRALAYKRNTKEVKVKSLNYSNKAISEFNYTTSTSKLPSSNNQCAQMLDYIAQGTSYNERVGNQIFVKQIKITIVGSSCPGAGIVDNALYRVMVHNANYAYNTDIPYFFGSSNFQSFNAYLNRRSYNFYHDSYFRGQGTGLQATTNTGYSEGSQGHVFMKKFTIPVNRKVEFTEAGVVKNDRDRFGLAIYGFTPYMMKETNVEKSRQIACFDCKVRIYYTDS